MIPSSGEYRIKLFNDCLLRRRLHAITGAKSQGIRERGEREREKTTIAL